MSEYTSADWENGTLLAIDTPRDCTLPGAPAETVSIMEVVPAMQRLVQAFKRAGKPVVHVVRI